MERLELLPDGRSGDRRRHGEGEGRASEAWEAPGPMPQGRANDPTSSCRGSAIRNFVAGTTREGGCSNRRASSSVHDSGAGVVRCRASPEGVLRDIRACTTVSDSRGSLANAWSLLHDTRKTPITRSPRTEFSAMIGHWLQVLYPPPTCDHPNHPGFPSIESTDRSHRSPNPSMPNQVRRPNSAVSSRAETDRRRPRAAKYCGPLGGRWIKD